MTQQRIADYFGRDSEIVYPPVDVDRFSPSPDAVGEHYAIVSELMSHKQIGVAIEAFNRLRRPLVIVGDGPAARRLRTPGGADRDAAGTRLRTRSSSTRCRPRAP